MKRTVSGRKLLIASVGVATVLYACEKKDPYPPGNLMAPEPMPVEAGMVTSGNLMAPEPKPDVTPPPPKPPAELAVDPVDAGATKVPIPPNLRPPGNLMPPPPHTPAPKKK
jgi:hypothetical protein